jgi:tetratricopeptide (TPR) repeat protein
LVSVSGSGPGIGSRQMPWGQGSGAVSETADQDAAHERELARYLALATLADRQLPRLGFFPPAEPGTEPGTEPADPGPAEAVADPVAWFTAERTKLLDIARWACAHGRYRAAARLASRQLTFQFLQHRVDDADQVWRAIEQAAERAGDIATASEARFHLAWVMADGGRYADAIAALDRFIPILEARGVGGTLAVALYWRALCANNMDCLPEGHRDDAERCLGLARQLREPGIEVMALRVLGMALIRLGSHDRGIALCEQAVALAQEHGELAWEYYAVTTLAFALCRAGRHESAEGCCQLGLEVSKRMGSLGTGQAYLLGLLGDSYAGQGRYRESAESLASAMTEFEANGDLRGQALCLLKLGQAYIALGERQHAVGALQRCFPMFGELGLPGYEDATIRALDECRPAVDGLVLDVQY